MMDIKVPLDFYKLNADQSGFYRVSYPPRHLKILGQNAKDGLLSAEDKIGLLSDTLAMASSGHSNAKTSDVLDFLEGFEDEPSYFVWDQIFTTISAIEKAFIFEDLDLTDAIKVFQKQLIKKALKSIEW
jgi:aminopeptidase 2